MNATTTSPLPWFYMYAANYLSDKRFRMMRLEDRGLLFTLLLELWANESLPADPRSLSQFLGLPENDISNGLQGLVGEFFIQNDYGLRSIVLDSYREKFQAKKVKQQEGGRKGADRKKFITKQNRPDDLPEGQPLGQPEGSLIQIKSSQIKSTSVYQEVDEGQSIPDELKPWVAEYESSDVFKNKLK